MRSVPNLALVLGLDLVLILLSGCDCIISPSWQGGITANRPPENLALAMCFEDGSCEPADASFNGGPREDGTWSASYSAHCCGSAGQTPCEVPRFLQVTADGCETVLVEALTDDDDQTRDIQLACAPQAP